MTFDEFKKLTTPLAVQLGAEWDLPTWKLYHRAVEKVPINLYALAVQKAAETRTKFPSAGQMRDLAEDARQSLLLSNPHAPCAECEASPGWVTVRDTGVERLARCRCWHAWRQRLEAIGAGDQPLALPASQE